MTADVRISFGTNLAIQTRLRELAERFNVSQSKLVESLLLQPDEQIKQALDVGLETLKQARAERLRQKRELAKRLNTMLPEDLARLTNGNG